MVVSTLCETARALVASGKGLLAADESYATIEKRFSAMGITSSEESRRDYREMLLTAPGAEHYISGVILFDETIRQTTANGTPFPELLSSRGIIPGIKVDKGARPMAERPGELLTEGLDGLRGRLAEYVQLGARFAKWRAVISIGLDRPSRPAVRANAMALAVYAAACQEAGLVPIVEPEVLMDGSHSIVDCHNATVFTIRTLFHELSEMGVALREMLLKPNMVVPGSESSEPATVAGVADHTLDCLYDVVPASVPGVVFLSGGQNDVVATEHLNEMNRRGPHPWQLSFSYARALQSAALEAWGGDNARWADGQAAFVHRARLNSAARSGSYSPEMERAI